MKITFCFFIYILLYPKFSDSFEYLGLSTINYFINSIKDVVFYDNSAKNETIPEDASLNIAALANKYGYEIQEHIVTTEDGYILKLQRIPSKKALKNNNVIFLMHGILDSADSWILQGPKSALGYFLADEGFDVWMGNARGNQHSQSHTTLDPKSVGFWKFSWEEIAIYDLPAMIDYVLNVTGKKDLYYVGHSQGTTIFYVMNALKPDYNKKVKMMFSLSPIAWMGHAKSPILKFFTPAYGILGYLSTSINTYASSTDLFNNIPKYVCKILPTGCDNFLQMVIGNDYKYIDESLTSIILGHLPSPSSTLQFIHYGQLYQSGRFCRFDYGLSENLLRYGQVTPPDYDLKQVTVPIVLYYSSNDWLSDPADVGMLFNKLPYVYNTYYLENFNHFDYMYAGIAKSLIYTTIIKEIQEFESYIAK